MKGYSKKRQEQKSKRHSEIYSEDYLKKMYGYNRVYTTGEVARICGISQQTVIRCYDRNLINGYLIPGSRYRKITHKNLVDFMIKNNIPLEGLDNFLEPDSSKNL